jgi:2-dehydropantoate 2-reductase
MRYIIYGAGSIGGTIGASLFEAGHDVVLIARGDHGRAIAERGLRFGTPAGGWRMLPIPAVEHPSKLAFRADDVVVLAMQSQGTALACEALAFAAPPETPVACAQNGIENERVALRHFANVHGMSVRMAGAQPEPGTVAVHDTPGNGIVDVGRYPQGLDDLDRRIAADLESANIGSSALDDVMANKRAKLALNVSNTLEAAMGRAATDTELSQRARQEALDVFAAAGMTVATARDPRVAGRKREAIDGTPYGGNSAFASLARGRGRLEADYLNGEIVLLGRLHGVPTPANAILQQLAVRLVTERVPPGSMTIADIEAGTTASSANRG